MHHSQALAACAITKRNTSCFSVLCNTSGSPLEEHIKYTDESVGPFPSVSNPKRTLVACVTTILCDLHNDVSHDMIEHPCELCDVISVLAGIEVWMCHNWDVSYSPGPHPLLITQTFQSL